MSIPLETLLVPWSDSPSGYCHYRPSRHTYRGSFLCFLSRCAGSFNDCGTRSLGPCTPPSVRQYGGNFNSSLLRFISVRRRRDFVESRPQRWRYDGKARVLHSTIQQSEECTFRRFYFWLTVLLLEMLNEWHRWRSVYNCMHEISANSFRWRSFTAGANDLSI